MTPVSEFNDFCDEVMRSDTGRRLEVNYDYSSQTKNRLFTQLNTPTER